MDESKALKELRDGLIKTIQLLEESLNERFERMKKIIIDYLSLGSDFAKGSLITALKQV